jgi:hypothetical protein
VPIVLRSLSLDPGRKETLLRAVAGEPEKSAG